MTSGVSSGGGKPRNSSTPSSLRTTRATAASLNLWTTNVQRSSRYPLRSAAEPGVEAPGRLLSPRSQPKTCGRPPLAIFVVRGRSSPPAKIRKRIAQAVATARRAAARRRVPRAARASPLAPPSSDHRHLAVVSGSVFAFCRSCRGTAAQPTNTRSGASGEGRYYPWIKLMATVRRWSHA